MLVSSIGMQFLTNSANNKQTEELAEKQRRFRDMLDRQRLEHSFALQSELNRIQSEMELGIHELRMKEINDAPDHIVAKLAQQGNVDSWPLNILPFVIKGESIGSMIGGGSNTIAVHCFLTPSNSSNFNKNVYTDLDIRLQSAINSNWSTRTSHPIYYYGGSWKDKNTDINHISTCIQQLEANLENNPCIVITPKFTKEGVKFCIKIWGMGENGHQDYEFLFRNVNDTDSFDSIRFSYNYSIENKFDKNDFTGITDNTESAQIEADRFVDTTLYEFSTYLQVVIGVITDMYFWNIYGLRPILPTMIANGSISTDGLKWIVEGVKRLYFKTVKESFSDKQYESTNINPRRLSELYTASLLLWSEPNELNKVSHIVDDYCSRQPEDVKLIRLHSFSITSIYDLIINSTTTDQSLWNAISYFYWTISGGQRVQSYDEMDVDFFSFSDIETIGEATRVARTYMQVNSFRGLKKIIRHKIESKF